MTITEELKSATDRLTEAITDNDVPLDKKEPGVSFAVVALTYLILLFAALGLLATVLWFVR